MTKFVGSKNCCRNSSTLLNRQMKKICFITAVPMSAQAFLRDHMAALQKEYSVYYVSGEPDNTKIDVAYDGYHYINIQRGISVKKDITALWQLYKYFRSEKFDSVHSVTPKAGLLTSIASFFARIPIRIHIFTGQVWANKSGFSRWSLKFMDKVIARFDNHLLVDGEGQRQFLIKAGVLKESNSLVLGKGSICGVNLERFTPSDTVREVARTELKIELAKIVFVFLGRLNHDKGLYDLMPAFDKLAGERNDVYLLLFGNDEENVASHFNEYQHLKSGVNFCYYGPTSEPQKMLQAGDVFVLPTYREGFGTSVIEASSLGLPVICSDVYGVMDAMIEGETGLRCKVGDSESLYIAMKELADNPGLRQELGKRGRLRTVKDFDGKKMSQHWVDYYRQLFFNTTI